MGSTSLPLYTTDALILRTYKLGDADRIVVFLTSDRGKRRGVARGARRTRSRFLGALEPLTRVVVAYVERERRDLVQLREVETVRSPLAARDPDALGYVGYFAELIDECAPEADPNERLYRLGASVVEALSQGGAGRTAGPVFRVLVAAASGRVSIHRGLPSVCGGSPWPRRVGGVPSGRLHLRAVWTTRRRCRSVTRGARVSSCRRYRRARPAGRARVVGARRARAGGGAPPADQYALGEGAEVDQGAARARRCEHAPERSAFSRTSRGCSADRGALRPRRRIADRRRPTTSIRHRDASRSHLHALTLLGLAWLFDPPAAWTSRSGPARCTRRRFCECWARSPGRWPTCSPRGDRPMVGSARIPTGCSNTTSSR